MIRLIEYFLQFFKAKPQPIQHRYKRIFVAMDIPQNLEATFRQIERRIVYNLYNEQSIEQQDLAIRSEPHLHITLAFLGQIEESKVSVVYRALKHAKKIFIQKYPSGISIQYEKNLKIFGSALVLPIVQTEELLFLHTVIIDTLKNYGIHFKNVHEFSAHTTLSRIDLHKLFHTEDGVKKLYASISLVIHESEKLTFQSNSFKLYQSISGAFVELGHYDFSNLAGE